MLSTDPTAIKLTDGVRFAVREDVALIVLDNPPVNAMSLPMRAGIVAAIKRAEADHSIAGVVLIGANGRFVAGADIKQLGGLTSPPPSYATLEACSKPVVAAIAGHALGGGLEHALACHYRIAAAGAKLGLPEVSLGIVPGGGGTQRLPRLVGCKPALDLILNAAQIGPERGVEIGLIDEIVDDVAALEAAALAAARRLATDGGWRRTGELPPPQADDAAIADARATAAKRYRLEPARRAAIDAVEAATRLPLAEGIAFERALFEQLRNSPEAQGLRYAFFAEREAAKVPGLDRSVEVRPVNSVAVIGAGTMGTGIAIALADRGVSVTLIDIDAEALGRGMARIKVEFDRRVSRGALREDGAVKALARIAGATSFDATAQVDAIIEAAFEDIAVKDSIFSQVDAAARPGALLLSNTSGISIDLIAASTARPGDVAGAHFFSPANIMKLVEVVRGPRTSDSTMASVMAFGRRIGKVAVPCGDTDGFVANRSRTPMVAEANILVEEGARPEEVDAVMMDFGYASGPFASNDLAGLDISYATRKRRKAADPDFRMLPIADRLVEVGRLGQKAGAGWYRYEPGNRKPIPDPAIDPIVDEVRRAAGIVPRTFGAEEILRRLLFASVNEACKIIEEGVAYRASDVDVMWLYGFNFPRVRGGLLFWADTIGAGTVLDQIKAWHAEHGDRWRPCALLEKVAHGGGRLVDAHAMRDAQPR